MEKVMNEKIIMNYEVVELLHKSSSWGNIVFKVKPQNKEKLYVLKCFPKIENGLQKLIFKREIEALRTLNVCEGIVKLRDSSTELYPFKENECYGGILMDYVPGETLDHINWNKYTQLKKYEICLQILKAVNNAHSNNVIHRDLKPSNIIYDKYADKVTLIDFGTSKIKTVMDSETTMPLYSEGYSAPELILGKNITEKCDYYSIGIIMSEILLSQKNGSDINSRIEEWTGRKEIKDILLSLVQEKPENRPESLENVIVILERLIGNLNTSSCSYSIAIDSRKLVQLKRNSIVEENMTMVQFTNSFLKNEFKQSYGYYDVKDQQYVITGEKMIMKCGYDENEQKMYVTYVGKITADRRNINIKRSFRIVGQISFVLNSRDNGYDPQDNHQLVVMFKNHQDDNKQYQLQEEKFENLFGGWEIGLTEAVEKEKGKSAIIKYDKYEINGGQLIFNLIDCEKKSIDELMPPTRFVVESQGQKGVIYTEVGNFEEVVCDDDSVKIVLSLTKGRLKPTVRQLLNKNTPLLEDFRAKTMAYKRQFRAIFDLKKDEYSARSLKDIILCLDEPEEIKTISQPTITDKNEVKKWEEVKKIQEDWINRLVDQNSLDYQMIRSAVVIAGTCVGFLSNEVIKDMSFDYVIIDEAAKATTPELLVSIIKAKKIILVGDQNQLPAYADAEVSPTLAKLTKNPDYRLFDILYNSLPDTHKQILTTQYRMIENIGNLISKVFYRGIIDTGCNDDEKRHGLSRYVGKSIVWFDTSANKKKSQKRTKGGSYINEEEKRIILEILDDLKSTGELKGLDIGIITGYSGQKELLRKSIKATGLDKIASKIDINTLDAFQGRENDIIIYSTVRTRDSIGFQKEKERVNVAFSRAKKLLIVCGDKNFFYNFDDQDNKFVEIIDYISEEEECEIIQCDGGKLFERESNS